MRPMTRGGARCHPPIRPVRTGWPFRFHPSSLRSPHRSHPSHHPPVQRSRPFLRMLRPRARSARSASGLVTGSCSCRGRCGTRPRPPQLPPMLKEKSNESYDPPASAGEQEPCTAHLARCSEARPSAAAFSRALPPRLALAHRANHARTRGVEAGACAPAQHGRPSQPDADRAIAGARPRGALSTARRGKIPR
jgi:hypothetical protein